MNMRSKPIASFSNCRMKRKSENPYAVCWFAVQAKLAANGNIKTCNMGVTGASAQPMCLSQVEGACGQPASAQIYCDRG
jgi:hypothetical protein